MATYVPLPGSKRSLLANSRPAGSVDPSEIATLTVRVRAQTDAKSLEQLVYEQAAKPLADREYMTREKLAEAYGASKEDLDKIEEFAQQHDLTVVHRNAAERSIVLKGTLGKLMGAFHVDVQLYHHAEGTYRGRRGEISLPKELSQIVTGVFGFDTRRRHRAPHRLKSAAKHGPTPGNGVAATEFVKRYKFPTTGPDGRPLDGSGQTIALIELGGSYRRSDLSAFFREIGVPDPSVSAVSVDHGGNHPFLTDPADGEVMLDIEVAGAAAPNAKIVVYFAPNTDKGFLDAISKAVHDTERRPSVISISWGGPEVTTDQQGLAAFHEVFAEAALLGVTVCAAAGDHGTADQDSSHWDEQIHVDHPACDDLVLGCGGTQIDGGVDVVWNDGTPFDVTVRGGGGWATGGGISQVFPIPSYQKNLNVECSIVSGKQGRGVPDLAMSATDYFTRVDGTEGPSGGTSAVAPLMAALVARLNQAKNKNVGFLNPWLYANAANGVTKDVTSGTNAIKNTAKGYSARPGWDACTGLGTPDGEAMLARL